jgi:hypothetical protein
MDIEPQCADETLGELLDQDSGEAKVVDPGTPVFLGDGMARGPPGRTRG